MILFHSILSKLEIVLFKPQMNLVYQISLWWNVVGICWQCKWMKIYEGVFSKLNYSEVGELICTAARSPAGGRVSSATSPASGATPLLCTLGFLLGTVGRGPCTTSEHSTIRWSREWATPQASPVGQMPSLVRARLSHSPYLDVSLLSSIYLKARELRNMAN